MLSLRLRDDLVPLAGVLRCNDGLVDFEHASIGLDAVSSPLRLRLNVSEPGPRAEVPFTFAAIPPGEYTLSMFAENFRAVPEELLVRAGDEEIVVVCEDRHVTRVHYEFEVRDSDTGKLILYPTVRNGGPAGCSISVGKDGEGHADVVVGEDTEWMMARRVIRIRELCRQIDGSPSTVNRYLKVVDLGFPRPIRLGPRDRAWYEDEVDAWLESRPRIVPSTPNSGEM